jgi:glucosamine--fructose-6-phosphate aminotransferase (isomerizing)
MLGQWMEAEIREQPGLFVQNVQRYYAVLKSALEGKSFDMVLLAARGSSDNAALYARYLIEIHLKIPVSLAAPSVLTRFGSRVKYPKCLAIGISQSGAAPDVSEVLAAMRADGHETLAVTNTEGSRLSNAAAHTLLLETGEEKSVAATKTYTSSLLAMYQMVRAMGGGLESPDGRLPGPNWLEVSHQAAVNALGPVLRSQTNFTLGRGYGFCTAQESALKLMECALLPCKSYSVADFEHGPRALAVHGSAAIIFGEPSGTLSEQGALVVQAPTTPQGPLGPMWDIFFGQWLALLAARARGLDPDVPQNIHKVTETL